MATLAVDVLTRWYSGDRFGFAVPGDAVVVSSDPAGPDGLRLMSDEHALLIAASVEPAPVPVPGGPAGGQEVLRRLLLAYAARPHFEQLGVDVVPVAGTLGAQVAEIWWGVDPSLTFITAADRADGSIVVLQTTYPVALAADVRPIARAIGASLTFEPGRAESGLTARWRSVAPFDDA